MVNSISADLFQPDQEAEDGHRPLASAATGPLIPRLPAKPSRKPLSPIATDVDKFMFHMQHKLVHIGAKRFQRCLPPGRKAPRAAPSPGGRTADAVAARCRTRCWLPVARKPRRPGPALEPTVQPRPDSHGTGHAAKTGPFARPIFTPIDFWKLCGLVKPIGRPVERTAWKPAPTAAVEPRRPKETQTTAATLNTPDYV